MATLILLLLLLFVVFCVFIFCVKNFKVRLNGFLFFSIGFVYYWLLPGIVLYFSSSFVPEELYLPFYEYSRISEENNILYGLVSFFIYASFAIGYMFTGPNCKTVKIFPKSEKGDTFFWSFMVSLAIVFATIMALPVVNYFFKAYDSTLFVGYENGVMRDALPRGGFVAATSMLFVFCFMRAVHKSGHLKTVSKILLDPCMLIYYGFSILVLSMGIRLYFFTSAVSLLIFFSIYFDIKIRLRMVVFIGLISVGVATFWGVIRAGEVLSFEKMILNLMQEPILTSISLFSFLDDGKFPLFNFPIFLVSNFLNLIPSYFSPEKMDYFFLPQDFGYKLYTPLGGLHLFVSLIINFGVVGAAFFLGCIGFLVGKFERLAIGIESIVIYCCLCGWLMFSLHRDPFSVSLVKNIFEISFFIPLVLCLVKRVIFGKHV